MAKKMRLLGESDAGIAGKQKETSLKIECLAL